MSNVIVRTKELEKSYRLYTRQFYRALDMLGFLRKNRGYFTTHTALSNINLEIKRGEKVAIIGRNGAGKSTLLKLISGAIEPTSGTLKVNGGVHAMLEIGTGFHAEFTGRENVQTYLAHIGISGRESEEKVEEIVRFAEVEEYIDQPVKTYSTGMGMRLMFAASTIIQPDILVIDEVLSVGDGYFAKKSFDKIKELCDGDKTTLLLVTHDIYTAMAICDRFIWIDNGAIRMDGKAQDVANKYETSIKDEHEQRLRRQRVRTLEANIGLDKEGQSVKPSFAHIRCEGNAPIDQPLPIRRITVMSGDTMIAEIHPGEEDDSGTISLLLGDEIGNWAPATQNEDKSQRSFSPYGSIFHRAPFLISAPETIDSAEAGRLYLEIEYRDNAHIPCFVEVLPTSGGRRYNAPLGNAGSGVWVTRRMELKKSESIEVSNQPFSRYGTQALRINGVDFLDSSGKECLVFKTGEPMKVRLNYKIEDPDFCEKPVIMLSFVKDGTIKTHRFVLDDILFDASTRSEGFIEASTGTLLLGPGNYQISIQACREGAYSQMGRNVFFAVNDQVLDTHSRAYEIKVTSGDEGPRVHNMVFVHPVNWEKDGEGVSLPLT